MRDDACFQSRADQRELQRLYVRMSGYSFSPLRSELWDATSRDTNHPANEGKTLTMVHLHGDHIDAAMDARSGNFWLITPALHTGDSPPADGNAVATPGSTKTKLVL